MPIDNSGLRNPIPANQVAIQPALASEAAAQNIKLHTAAFKMSFL